MYFLFLDNLTTKNSEGNIWKNIHSKRFARACTYKSISSADWIMAKDEQIMQKFTWIKYASYFLKSLKRNGILIYIYIYKWPSTQYEIKILRREGIQNIRGKKIQDEEQNITCVSINLFCREKGTRFSLFPAALFFLYFLIFRFIRLAIHKEIEQKMEKMQNIGNERKALKNTGKHAGKMEKALLCIKRFERKRVRNDKGKGSNYYWILIPNGRFILFFLFLQMILHRFTSFLILEFLEVGFFPVAK